MPDRVYRASGMLAAAAVTLGCSAGVSAQTTVYTDQAAFRAAAAVAVGSGETPAFIEDFNHLPNLADITEYTGGPFTLSETGDGEAKFIKDATAVPPAFYATTALITEVDNSPGSDTLTFTFDEPVTAFGYELSALGNGNDQVVFSTDLASEFGLYVLGPRNTTEFRGFIFGTPISAFTIAAAPTENFAYHGVDNVEIFAIPEPAATLPLALAAGAVAVRRRRQKVAC